MMLFADLGLDVFKVCMIWLPLGFVLNSIFLIIFFLENWCISLNFVYASW